MAQVDPQVDPYLEEFTNYAIFRSVEMLLNLILAYVVPLVGILFDWAWLVYTSLVLDALLTPDVTWTRRAVHLSLSLVTFNLYQMGAPFLLVAVLALAQFLFDRRVLKFYTPLVRNYVQEMDAIDHFVNEEHVPA